MKRKLILVSVIISCFSFLCGSVLAQGIYSKNSGSSDSDSQGTSSGVGLRGGPGPGGPDPNGGGGDQTGEPGSNSPVGEGLLILTVLTGGYAIFRKRNTEENE